MRVFYVLVLAFGLGPTLIVVGPGAFLGTTNLIGTDAELGDLDPLMVVAMMADNPIFALLAILVIALAYGSAGLRDLRRDRAAAPCSRRPTLLYGAAGTTGYDGLPEGLATGGAAGPAAVALVAVALENGSLTTARRFSGYWGSRRRPPGEERYPAASCRASGHAPSRSCFRRVPTRTSHAPARRRR
ncbi:hypothetical protein [Actinomycetospora chibensis]|uniref:Uncharacterized protein n=1 Tax=Actinomycetospora chibensis TaxID=663606 RepID=A0ABV9RLL0_9PSEU|nr:hypothetical protein [Actinomycetospora chibensis]MDD7924623.1 hypothetical protein [Actinomycetospora chibensis]